MLTPSATDRSPAEAHVAGPSWFALCIGAWATMFGALAAAAPLIDERAFVLKIGLLLVVAFPTVYYLHFTRVSRMFVHWLVFLGLVGFGVVELIFTWPQEGVYAFYGLTSSFRILVKGFLWVMAFRAFGMRGLQDLVLSAVPAVSCIILVMVSVPTPLAVGGAALVILGTLYLLAAESLATSTHEGDEIRAVRQVVLEGAPRRGAAINSWQSVSVVVLIAAILASAGASYMQFSSQIGESIQVTLARYLAGYLIGERNDFSPEPMVFLTGESPPQGDRVLFVVECDRGENWRQQVYTEYTGHAWQLGKVERRRGERAGSGWRLDPAGVSGFRPQGAVQVKQVFNLKVPIGSSLPALFCAVEVKAPTARIFGARWGTVHPSGYVGAGRSYEIVSLIPAEGPAPLTAPLPPMEPELRERYLRLPARLPDRVRELTENVVAEATGEYSSALAIQNYLVDNYPYTLTPEARPKRADFVDHFLFEAKEGYCTHYASAMAVMCRTIGIPSRLVTGFVAGELDPEADTYEVRQKDAHAWVEVYIEGRGWQPFEPTPPLGDDEEEGSFASAWARVMDGLADFVLLGGGFVRARPWVAGLLLTALISLLAAWALARRSWYRQVRLNGKDTPPNSRVEFVYGKMLLWLGYFGLPRGRAQAPLEYVADVARRAQPVAGEVAGITAAFMKARYGPAAVSDAEASRAEETLTRLRDALFAEKAVARPRAAREA